MRQLATIQRIAKLDPIEGKDKIVLATVLGWKVIVPKDEYKVGDFCVYVEIDSILPERPEFEFLRKRCFSEKKGGFHIKTMKMGGVISQGIVFPLSVVPFNTYSSAGLSGYGEGDDVTELLGIRKWDPEINDPAPRNISHKNPIINYMLHWKWFRNWLYPPTPAWPEWMPHTDETRLQALGDTWLHENFLGKEMVITEKIDGCVDFDALIQTQEGLRTIKSLCDEDFKGEVLSWNHETERAEYRKVLGFSRQRSKKDTQWYELETNTGEKLVITGNHRIYLPELGCYRRVEDLVGGETLQLT